MYNSVDACGSLSIQFDGNSIVIITDNTFYYNGAESIIIIDTSGGAVCTYNVSVLFSNCTFASNRAKLAGGALVCHYSIVAIYDTVFFNNSAGQDGGALVTYVHPSNYTIVNSSFTYNEAGDDGGSLFVGRRGSHVKINGCIFTNNHAMDRGGAVAIFGGAIQLSNTEMYSNVAEFGESINSCNSNVTTSVSFWESTSDCSSFDINRNHFSATPARQSQNYCKRSITLNLTINIKCWPTIIVGGSCSSTLREINAVTFVSLTLSITVTLIFALMLCFAITKAINSNTKFTGILRLAVTNVSKQINLVPGIQSHS